MASSSNEPSEDGLSQLSATVETETAWGRSRFTEAEIKKAFELRDHELRRAEQEVAAIKASEAGDKKVGTKGDQKRVEAKKIEAARKEDLKAKKKEEAKKKKDGDGLKEDDSELDDPKNAEIQEQAAWRAMMTYNFSQDAQELASLLAEQKRAESFEEWAIASPGNLAPAKQSLAPVFESQIYQVRNLCPPHSPLLLRLVAFRIPSLRSPFLVLLHVPRLCDCSGLCNSS